MKRASYRHAISWIAENDDTDWLGDNEAGEGIHSVSALLVADLFDVHPDKVARDLRQYLSRGEERK
jgi:hypothetical protein